MSNTLFVTVPLIYGAIVGNHGLVVRWTYTVPAGKRAECRYLYGGLTEPTAIAATTAAVVIRLNAANILTLYSLNRVDYKGQMYGNTFDLVAGDTIDGLTVNGAAVNAFFEAVAILRLYS